MSASGGGSRTTPTYNIPQELQVGEWIVLAACPEGGFTWPFLLWKVICFECVHVSFSGRAIGLHGAIPHRAGMSLSKKLPSSLPSPMKAEDLVILPLLSCLLDQGRWRKDSFVIGFCDIFLYHDNFVC